MAVRVSMSSRDLRRLIDLGDPARLVVTPVSSSGVMLGSAR